MIGITWFQRRQHRPLDRAGKYRSGFDFIAGGFARSSVVKFVTLNIYTANINFMGKEKCIASTFSVVEESHASSSHVQHPSFHM
jgi:hypothetical protein